MKSNPMTTEPTDREALLVEQITQMIGGTPSSEWDQSLITDLKKTIIAYGNEREAAALERAAQVAHNGIGGKDGECAVAMRIEKAIRSLSPDPHYAERLRLEGAIAKCADATRIADSTPFRWHAKDDVDFHSGCVQTKDGIVKALRKRKAEIEARLREMG